jgi:hypothetical protein
MLRIVTKTWLALDLTGLQRGPLKVSYDNRPSDSMKGKEPLD